MALIPCSECGREVSDRATACPQCGAPVGAPWRLPAAPSMEEWARAQLTAGSPRRQVVDQIVQHGTLVRTDADALVKRVEADALGKRSGAEVRWRLSNSPVAITMISIAIFILILLRLFVSG